MRELKRRENYKQAAKIPMPIIPNATAITKMLIPIVIPPTTILFNNIEF